jgi:hypothetical protein
MSYTAESIAVLKGLEPVRHRPGMYTRIDCPLHIIQEAIDNAADEALGGFCKRITVTLHSRPVGQRRGRRARYSGRDSPARTGADGRSGVHPAARGRQVQQG